MGIKLLISEAMEGRPTRLGAGVLRWSLVLFFVGFGLSKFTPQEAAGVAPLTAHKPLSVLGQSTVWPALGTMRAFEDRIGDQAPSRKPFVGKVLCRPLQEGRNGFARIGNLA